MCPRGRRTARPRLLAQAAATVGGLAVCRSVGDGSTVSLCLGLTDRVAYSAAGRARARD